jgi:LysM repeat protein
MSDKGLQQQPGGRDYVQESQGTVGGGSLVSRVGGPRNAAVLAAGATVAVVALLGMMRGKGAGNSSAASGDSAYDSGPYDMWNQWQEEYEQLQEQISASGGGTTTATGPGTPARPVPPPWPPVQIKKPPVRPPAPKPPAPPAKPKPSAKTVVVKKGDSLSAIAKKNGISMATLKKLNPVYWTNKKYKNGSLIWAGDKVKV